MIDLALSLALFSVTWLLHVLWFRVRQPRARIQGLLLLFSSGGLVLAAGLAWAPWRHAGVEALVRSPALPVTAIVLYVLLSLVYIVVYTAVEVDSPSVLIALLVHHRGAQGITYAELREALTNENLVLNRLADLVAAGSVSSDGSSYRLEARGLIIARVFAAYRALLGRGLGG